MVKHLFWVSSQRRPWALLAAASCILGGTIPGARAQTMVDNLINHYCAQAMNADFAKAGKTPPTGMVAPRMQLAAARRAHGRRCELTQKRCLTMMDPQVPGIS